VTKEEFFKIWKRNCDEHDLFVPDGLLEAIGGHEVFTQDELDDRDLYLKVDDALGRYLIARDDLGDIFMDLEDEFK
jgi:hypothetical protein